MWRASRKRKVGNVAAASGSVNEGGESEVGGVAAALGLSAGSSLILGQVPEAPGAR